MLRASGVKLNLASGLASAASRINFSTALMSRSTTEATVGGGCGVCRDSEVRATPLVFAAWKMPLAKAALPAIETRNNNKAFFIRLSSHSHYNQPSIDLLLYYRRRQSYYKIRRICKWTCEPLVGERKHAAD